MKTYILKTICSLFVIASMTNNSLAALPSPINPSLSCQFPTVKLKAPLVVYDDQQNSKFTQNIWGGTSTIITDNPYKGSKAIEMDFDTTWSGIEFVGSQLYEHDTVGAIQVAVRGNMSNLNIRIYLIDLYGNKLGIDVHLPSYILRGSFTPDWQVISVPIADMLGSLQTPIGGFGFQSETTGQIWIDNIKLLTPEPEGLATLYSEHPQAAVHRWLSYVKKSNDNPFRGDSAIEVNFTNAWGGFTLHTKKPLSEDDFGAITFAVKTNTSGLNLYVYLVDENGQMDGLALPVSDFLYSGEISSDWKIAWIPLRKLIRRPTQGTFVFNGIGVESTMTGKVWVDEVKVREEFKLPLPGEKEWLLITETGDTDCFGTYASLPSHLGTNHFSLDFDDISAVGVSESNVPVLASASGRVVFAGKDTILPGNGTYVIINHDYREKGIGLETRYLHLRENSLEVEYDDNVVRGQTLGILDNSGSGQGYGTWGTHLHNGFYYNNTGNSTTGILNVLTMEGLKLDEYTATCAGGFPNRYYPSTQ